MKHAYPRLIAIASLLATACAFAADEKIDFDRRTPVPADQPIPLSDFLRDEFLSEPSINPAGTHVAAVVSSREDKNRVIVYDLATMKAEGYEPPGEAIAFNVNWLNDTRLVFKMGLYKIFSSGIYAGEVGRLSTPYPLIQYEDTSLLAVPQTNRTHPLVAVRPEFRDAGRDGHVYEIDTDNRTGKVINMMMVASASGEGEEVAIANRNHISDRWEGPTEGYDAGFLADRDGKIAFAFTSENGVFTMHRRVGDHWEKCPVDLDEVDVLGYGRTHDEVIVRGAQVDGKPRALQFMDAVSGKPGDVLVQDEAYDFDGSLYYQPGSHGVLGAEFQRNVPVIAWFNEDYQNLQKFIDSSFPGLVARVVGSDEAGKIYLVETYSDRQPRAYHWINLEKKSGGAIEKSMPWIDPQRMRPTNIIKYKTEDGKRIDAFVTLPAGASKEHPVPMIVLPSGMSAPQRSTYMVGMERATVEFNRQAQLWASRGYAVLQPNHRGSAGYGWMFPKEDQWNFMKMAEDITAATRAMVKSGYVDPKRVGIQGDGMAAYLAVAAAETDPDLYQAVVAIQGTYDWGKYLRTLRDAALREVNYGVLVRNLGNGANLDAISVDNKAAKIRAAVLVAYQREQGDYTAQSTNFAASLGSAGVKRETVAIGGDRSSITKIRNQVELYSKVADFYAKYLHP